MRPYLSVVCVAALLAACGGSHRRMNADIRRGPMPQGGTWAGVWFTNWGQLSLTTQGSTVVGQFCDEESNRFGRMEGTAQGNVFSFHWVTTDVTMAGNPRESEGSGIVQFSLVESGENEGMHFEGTWGYEGSNADGGPLRGDRSSRYSDQFLRGSYTIPCPLREEADAPPPMSEEEVGDNPGIEDYDTGGSDEGISDDDAGGEPEGGDDVGPLEL